MLIFLGAFGLKVEPQTHERVDHIRCECEFMAFLARKEAHATQTENESMLGETRKAQRLFLREHIGRFAPALGERLRREADGFYHALGQLLRRFVEAECRRFGIEPGADNLVLRESNDLDVPMMCGNGASCLPGGCPE